MKKVDWDIVRNTYNATPAAANRFIHYLDGFIFP